jgi:hypothetical protein
MGVSSELNRIGNILMFKPNMWEFTINEFNDEEIKYLVTEVSFPSLPKFENIKRSVGTVHTISYELPVTLTVTYDETEASKVFRYHLEWLDSFFDRENKVFKNGVVPYKTATLRLLKDASEGIAGIFGTLSSAGLTTVENQPNGVFIFDRIHLESLADLTFAYTEAEKFPLTYTYTIGSITIREKA